MNTYDELLNEARKQISSAMSNVQNASNLVKDFNKNKPLNILYKELRASEALLNFYTGISKNLPKQDYEVVTPQSIQAFHNLNDK